MSHEDAISAILDVSKEEYEYFSGQAFEGQSSFGNIEEAAKEFELKAKASKDYEEQMRHYENAEVLWKAIEIMNERGNTDVER